MTAGLSLMIRVKPLFINIDEIDINQPNDADYVMQLIHEKLKR